MCSLFGLLDYGCAFTKREKNAIISVLSTESEARGTDATGIAYNVYGRLCIYKRPLPAHMIHYAVPFPARYIMGHTRMTTQGSEKHNYNNHPFIGATLSGKFALAHNGIIHNDYHLRKREALPRTKIQTDSYVAAQLIEKQTALNFESLKQMAEKVEGSFTFTILDNQNNLYVVKGSNPFSLIRFPEWGFYLYASTNEILTNAVETLNLRNEKMESITLSSGEILKINYYGQITRAYFNTTSFIYGRNFSNRYCLDVSSSYKGLSDDGYVRTLKSVAFYYGYSPEEIDAMLNDGLSCEEIEEILCLV